MQDRTPSLGVSLCRLVGTFIGKRRHRRAAVRRVSTGLMLLSLFAMQFAQVAHAANDLYWDTNGTATGSGAAGGNWGTDNFWNTDSTGGAGGSFTTATSSANDVHFSAGTNGTTGTVAIVGTQAADSLIFDTNAVMTLSGGTSITLGGGTGTPGIAVSSTDNSATTISTALIFAATATTETFSNAGTGLLTVGAITGSATAGTQTLTLSSTSTGGMTLSGIIGNGGGGGNLALVVNNTAGLTTLSGANTFTGGLTIKNGTVSGATSATSFGNGTITLGDTSGSANATLNGAAFTYANPISIAAGNTGTATIGTNSAAPTYSGAVTLNSHNLTLSNNGFAITMTGGITGTGNLTLTSAGAGVITLSTTSVNNIGTITNNGGGVANTLISAGIGSNVTGIIENSATSALTISTNAISVNSGGTTLTNSNASGSALLTVSGGIAGTGNLILKNNSSIANGISITTTAVNNIGTITNSGTGTGVTLISAAVGANVTTITAASNTSAFTIGALALNAAGTTLTNSGTTLFTVNGAVTGTTNLTTSGTGTTTLTGVVSITGTTLAVTAGTLIIGGATNTFTSNITVDGATTVLQMTSGSNGTATNAPLGFANIGGTAFKTVTLTNGATFRPTASYNINTPSAALPGAGFVLSIGATGGTVDVATGVTLTIDDGIGTGTATTNAELQGSGTLTKVGVGTLSLGTGTSNFGNFTGAIVISAGTLTVGAGSSGGVTPLGATTAGTTIAGGAAFDLNGSTNASAEPLNISGTGLTSSPKGVLTNSSATAASFAGPITLGAAATIGSAAAGAITITAGISGTGNLTFSNTSTGGTTISTGAITIAGTLTNSGTGAGATTINTTFGPSVTSVTQNGASPLTLTVANTYTGQTTITAGTLNANAAGALGTGPIVVNGGTLAQTGIINGAAQTLSISSGTANLNLANTYGGLTSVSGTGILNASVSGAIPNALSISGGVVNASVANSLPSSVTMTGGILNVTATAGSANGANTITLNGGTITSGASGIGVVGGILGTVNGGSSLNTISPGAPGLFGQLNLTTLSTGSGTVLQLDVYNPWSGTPATTGDLLNILGSGGLTIASNTSVSFPNGTPAITGNYRLVQYVGATPNIANLAALPSQRSGAITYSFSTSVDPGFIDLIVNNVGGAGNPLSSNWINSITASAQSWIVPANWSNGVPQLSGDTAILNSAIAAAQTIQLNAQIHVGALTFNPNGGSGAGTYTIAQNTSTDNISFDNGTSAATVTSSFNNNTISAPVFLVSSNTNATVASGTVLTLSGAVAGTGRLTLASGSTGGTLTLNATSTYIGGLEADAGVINIPTATLNPLGGTTSGTGNVTLNGGTIIFSAGTTQLTAGAGQSFTIGSNGGTIIATGAGTTGKLLIGAGSLVGTGVFTKGGGADLQLTSANPGFTGSTIINGGFIEDQSSLGLGATGQITINSVASSTPAGSTTNGSTVLTVAATAGLLPGQSVTGTGVPAGAYITSILSSTTFQISAPATATGAGVTLTLGAQTGELVAGGISIIIASPIVLNAGGIISSNGTGAFLTGSLTVPATGTFILAPRQFQSPTTGSTFTVAGNITGGASLSLGTVTQTSIGNVILGGNNAGWTSTQGTSGNPFVLASAFQGLQFGANSRPLAATGSFVTLGGGNFGVLSEGDGFGGANVAGTFTDTFTVTASSTITVGRVGAGIPVGSPLFLTPANKIINESNAFSLGAFTLTVTNNNGYGLAFTNTTTLSAAATTLSVANASLSNQTQGLILQGQVIATNGFTKAGAGTLVLGSTGNNILTTITVGQGVLSVDADAELGAAATIVNLAPTAGTSTLRATGSFSTARTIQLGVIANTREIDVTTGNTLTLTSAFNLNGVQGALVKGDKGTLNLNAANGTWTGGITISDGALQLSNATAAGTGAITNTVAQGAALLLVGGAGTSFANAYNLTTGNAGGIFTYSGINNHGLVEAVSGISTLTTAIAQSGDGMLVGADNGATITLQGGITNTGGRQMGFIALGNGIINLPTAISNNLGAYAFNLLGTGTLNITAANNIAIANNMNVFGGTFALSGAGTFTGGPTIALAVQGGATLSIDDRGTATASRLGSRPITLNGATYTYIVNATATSTETEGNLVLGAGGSAINVNQPTGSQIDTLTFASLTQTAAGSTLNFSGVLGTSTNKILITANPTLSNGILPRDVVTGTGTNFDFATYGAANGIAAYAGYNTANNISAALTTDTVQLTASSNIALNTQTLNALAINGNGVTAGAALNFAVLNLTTGAVLATGGSNTLSVPLVALGATEGLVHVNTGSTLTMSGSFTGTAGVTKAEGGTLVLSTPQFYTGATNVNGGILQLTSGATNTLFFNNGLNVNAGGTLDLNGGVQYVGALASAGAILNDGIAGGTITSSTGTGTLVTNVGAASIFAGSINGSVAFAKSGTNTLTLLGSSSYTGGTLLTGGLTILADNGTITSAAPITINYATLQLDNSRLTDLSTRLNPAAPITLNGGALQYNGRIATLSTQTVGAVTLGQGLSLISSAVGSNSTTVYQGATLILTSLTRTGDAIVDFGQQYQTTSGNSAIGTLGLIGNGTGQSQNILVIGGIPLTNRMIGGWAVVTAYASNNSSNGLFFDFASYSPTVGVGMLATAGFPGYDATVLPTVTGTAAATQNIKITATSTLPTGGATTINALNLLSGAASTLTFTAPTDTLNLTSGGMIVSGNFANLIGAAANSGRLTAGGTASIGTTNLYVYNVQSTLTINAQIVDNPNGAKVQFIANGLANINNYGAAAITVAGANSYTGGTIVNGETLTIAATGTLGTGGIVLNSGTLTQVAGGSLGGSQALTLNGPSTATLVGVNTLTSLTINNSGGTTNPTLNAGTQLFLPSTITVSSSNVGTTATIAGTIDFANSPVAITVTPISFNSVNLAPLQATLNISAIIQNAGNLSFSGGGNLQLGAQSTFAGGVTAPSSGSLIVAGSSTQSVAGPLTAGPLGTGTLTLSAGATLLSSAGANTVLNPVNVQGNFTVGGINSLTLNGSVALPASTNTTLTVNAPTVTATLGGNLTGSGSSLTTAGRGTVVLAGTASNFSGGVTVNSGALQVTAGIPSGAATPLGTGNVTLNGGLLQLRNNTGATFNNGIIITSTLPATYIDINNNGAGTNNLFTFNSLNYSGATGGAAPSTILNVTGGNGYKLTFGSTNLTLDTTGATFFVGSGLTLTLGGTFSGGNSPINIGPGTLIFNNSGGTTISGVTLISAQANNTTTALGGGTLTLTNGSTLALNLQANVLNTTGYSSGGATGRYNLWTTAAPSLPFPGTITTGPAAVIGGVGLSDPLITNHPTGVFTAGASPNQDTESYSSLINISAAGIYSFGLNSDDQGVISIDGQLITHADTIGAGTGFAVGQIVGSINLAAGAHQLVVLHQNGGGGSGITAFYNGPDTNNSLLAAAPGWQTLPLSQLFYNTGGGVTGAATAANGYFNAAQINNGIAIAAGNTGTVDAQSSMYNITFTGMSLGAGSTLNVNNTQGLGFIGSIGALTVSGAGATVNTVGILNLIGGVSDGGNGLTKIGVGTLILGPSGANFTGPLAVNQGFVQISDSTALLGPSTALPSGAGTTTVGLVSTVAGFALTATTTQTVPSTTGLFPGEILSATGGTGSFTAGTYIVSVNSPTTITLSAAPTAGTPTTITFASGATLDLNGIPNVAGNLILNGAGPNGTNALSGPNYGASSTAGAALSNSSTTPGGFGGTVSIGVPVNGAAVAIGGYGNITLSGTVQDSATAGQAWSKVGPGTLTLGGTNTFTGVLTISGGILQTASTGALGATAATAITVANAATLDLNGQAIGVAKPLTLSGAGTTGLAGANTLGVLINSSATAPASYAGAITLGAAITIGSPNLAVNSATFANNGTTPSQFGTSVTDGSFAGEVLTAQPGDITLSGGIGAQAFAYAKTGSNTLFLTGTQANSGSPNNISLGQIVLSGGGNVTGATAYSNFSGSVLTLDNSGTNVVNRLGLHSLTLSGANFNLIGNAGAPSTEATASAFNFTSAGSVISLYPSSAQPLTFTTPTVFTYTNGASALFRGTGLGATAIGTANGSAYFVSTNANPGFSGNQTGNTGTNRGIVAWALVDTNDTGNGASFAAYSVANGFQALDFSTDGATNTLVTVNANTLLTANAATTANGFTFINSLTLNGGAATVSSGSVLPLISGGILNLSGTTASPNTISGPGAIAVFTGTGGNAPVVVHTPGTAALSISSQIASSVTSGLIKADAGTLILAGPQEYLGSTFVNGGTLQLANNNQTIFIGSNTGQTPGATGGFTNSTQALQVNLGGTLDLNGTNQAFGNITSAGTLPNTGGMITNSNVTTSNFTTVLNTASQTFAGSITGNINFTRSSGFTLTLESASSYSGTTTIQGGGTVLQDLGALTGTSAISLNGGALIWTDTGVQAVAQRIPAAATITMNTGSFVFNARGNTQESITIGNVALGSGSNLFTVNPTNGGATLNIGTGTGPSLTHSVGSSVYFTGANGIGDAGLVTFATPPTNTNGILGGWAVVNEIDPFIGQTFEPGFAVSTTNGLVSLNANLTSVIATGNNVRVAGNVTVPSGGITFNTVSIINAAATISFTNPTDTLTVTTGGILTGFDNNAKAIGAAPGSGQLTAGSGQNELFVHVAANTLTINATIVNNGVSGGLNLVADSLSTSSTLALTSANSYGGTTYLNGLNVTLNSSSGPAIPGNVIITGGVSASDSLANTTTFAQSNQIATGATVTLNGGTTLNLASFNNTIANLTINNTSGDVSGTAGTVLTGIGTLTVAGNVSVAASTNSFVVPQINGFLNLSNTTTPTISAAVNPLAPGQVDLDLAAAITLAAPTSTALTVTGGGVIVVNSQSRFANGTNVTSGTTLGFGTAAATTGSAATFGALPNSQVNLAGGTTLDTRENTGAIGSLSGSGTLTNTLTSGTLAGGTLITGVDSLGAASGVNTTFSGSITNPFVTTLLNVTKDGTGTMTLTANNSGSGLNSPNLGTLAVNGGGITLSGNGQVGFGAYTLTTGGTLLLDNSGTAVNNRLGTPFQLISPTVQTATTVRNLNFNGGNLTVNGNSITGVKETLGTINSLGGGGTLTLNAASTGGIFASFNAIPNQGVNNSLYIVGFGLATANSTGAPVANAATLFPTAIGFNSAGTTNTNGSTTLQIRSDIIATDTATNFTGFLTKDSVTGQLRPLNPGTELTAGLSVVTTTTNAGISNAAQGTISANNNPGTITLLNSAAGVSSGILAGNPWNASGGLLALNVAHGGILALGTTNTINIGQLTNGDTYDLQVPSATSTLTINAPLVITNGFVKAGAGTAILQQPYYSANATASSLAVNGGGTLQLAGGANTLWVQPTLGIAVASNLQVNAGTLDLTGNGQIVASFTSSNATPYAGGTVAAPGAVVTNSSATAANFIIANTANSTTTFGGVISGNLSFFKQQSGTNAPTVILESPNTYSGTTNLSNGILALRDSGALPNTSSAINFNYGALLIDNTGLSDSTTRISATAPLNFNGGTLSVAAGPTVETQNVGTAALIQGYNIFQIAQYNNNAQTGSFTLSAAGLTTANSTQVNFIPGTGVTFGAVAANPHMLIGTVNGTATASVVTANNGIIGGYAVVNGADFATYNAAQGVLALSTYTTLTASGASASVNYQSAATLQSILSQTVNSYAVRAPAAATTIALADASQVLNIGSGGLLVNDSGLKGVTIQGGQLTAGGSGTGPASLYYFSNGTQGQTINSQIVNNPNGAVVSLARAGGGTLTLTPEVIDTVATITAATATFNVTNAQGLFVGMGVSGAGIPASEFITAIAGNAITITTGTGVVVGANIQTAFAPPVSAATSGTTINSPTVTTAANSFSGGAAFLPTIGMAIGGPNIPGGSTLLSFTGTNAAGFTLTLSQNALATSATAVVTAGALSNTYTGTTYNNGGASIFGQVILAGFPGSITVPGNLVLTNAGVVENVQGQIAAASNVTFQSGGSLTLVGTNTLNSLTWAVAGSSGGTPTVILGTGVVLNLASATPITSGNDDVGVTPTIGVTATPGALNFTNTGAITTIATSGLSPDNLIINSQITTIGVNGANTGTTLAKTGAGSLELPLANAAVLNWSISNGSIILGNATSLGAAGSTLNISGTSTLLGFVASATNIAPTANITFTGATPTLTFGGTGNAAAGNNQLTWAGTVNLNGTAPTINVSSAPLTDTITGQISGAGGFTKGGPGALTLTPGTPNSFTGPITISAGLLTLGNATALPAASLSDMTVGALAELNINNFATTIGSLSGAGIVTSSGGTAGIVLNIGGGASTATFSGVITAATPANLALTKSGTNTQILSSTNVYTGATLVGDGTAANNGTLVLATPGSSSNTAVSVSLATLSVRPGTGSYALGNTATTAAGATLTLGSGALFNMTDAAIGTFNITNGATFAGANNLIIGAATGTAPVLTFDIGSTVGSIDKIVNTKAVSVLATGGKFVFTPTGTSIALGNYTFITGTAGLNVAGLTLQSPTLTIGPITYNLTLAPSTSTAETVGISAQTPASAFWSGAVNSAWNTGAVSGVTNWRTDATSNIDTQAVPSAATNVFFNTTTPVAANLATNVLGADFSINSLSFTASAGAATIGGANTLTLGAGGVNMANGSAAQILGTNVALGAAQTWTNSSTTNTLTVNGVVSGTGPLTIVGPGTVVLTGLNTFTGAVLINSGTLSVSNVSTGVNPQALGVNTATAVTLGVAATSSGTLLYTGPLGTLSKNITAVGNGTDTIQNSGTGQLTLSGTLTKNGTVLTLSGGANGINVSGTIVGTNGGSDLNITGGLTTLSSANTYNGPTNIFAGGILKNGIDGALPSGTTLNLGSGNTIGTYDLNGHIQTVAGLTTSGTGTPQTITNSGASGTNALTVNNDAATSNADFTYSGVLADGATATTGLTKSGDHKLTLTNTTAGNNYSGGTSILGGVLSVSADANLGATAGAVSLGAGTLQYTASVTTTRQLNLTNAASTVDVQQSIAGNTVALSTGVIGTGGLALVSLAGPGTAAGKLALLGSGSYAGGTSINGGTLLINSATSMGLVTGAATINNATLEVNTNGLTGTSVGAISTSRNFTLGNANSAIKVDTNQTYTLTGTVSGPGSLNANGPGTLILAGTANSYTGPTNISNGTVLATNATGTSTGNGAVNVGTGGTLGGTGKIGGAINVNTGGIITAGNSATDPTQTGTLTSTAGTSTFNSGGTYNWKINNAAGTAGQANGWDLLSFSTLQVLSTSGTNNTFTIAIEGNNVQFNQDNTGNPYLFPIAVATTALTGFDASKFVLNTGNLTSNDSGIGTNGGHFSLVLDPGNSNQIDLSYNAVPEPTSLGLLALGALAFLKRPTRRRKAA